MRAALADEAERVRAWLAQTEPQGTGLAVFSCAPRGLWQPELLAVRVMDHLAFEPTPDVAPLLELIDEHDRYAVAVVDNAKARLSTVFAGRIEEREELADEVVTRHDQGGWSQSHYQRHQELHVRWHLAHVADRLAALHRRQRFDRLILAGPEEATWTLRHLLPRALAGRVVARVRLETDAGERALLDKGREVEERLLAELLDMVGPGGRATIGVAPTLAALWADTVQRLVVAHGLHADGSECPNCARLDRGRVESCPACGHAMRRVHDVFHRAMGRAVEQAASVEVLHGAAARRLGELGGGMGAVLRYPSPVPGATAA